MKNFKEMQKRAEDVAEFMKCFASPHRLMILCHLSQGEKNVSQLMELTGIAQTSMSQHLNKLRQEKLIDYDRDHRTLYYKITDPNVITIMNSLYEIYCKEVTEQ